MIHLTIALSKKGFDLLCSSNTTYKTICNKALALILVPFDCPEEARLWQKETPALPYR